MWFQQIWSGRRETYVAKYKRLHSKCQKWGHSDYVKKPIPTDAAEHTVWRAQQRACQDKQWRVLESAGYPTGGYPLNNLDPCPRAEHSSSKSSLFHSSDIRVFFWRCCHRSVDSGSSHTKLSLCLYPWHLLTSPEQIQEPLKSISMTCL